jgi:RNA polymerase sigma factor (sigma-70 family)
MTDTALPSDGELLAEFADSGGDRPFEQLVRRHAPLVLSVCRGILREPNDAEDAAQAAFLTLARKAPSLRGRETVAGWLHRVAWHVACRAREARELRRRREQEAAEHAQANRAPDSITDTHADAVALHEQLQAMPEKYRVPLILHHLEGWSEPELAQILGLKLGTLSGRLSRGRRMLKERLDRRGLGALAAAVGATGAALFAAAQRSEASEILLRRLASTRGSVQADALAQGALRMLSLRRARELVAVVAAASLMLFILAGGGAVLMARARATPPAASSPASAQPTVATTGAIIGRVVGPSGGPVRGATVRIYASQERARAGAPPIDVVRSGDDGQFGFERVEPGTNLFVLCFIQQPTFMHAETIADARAGARTDVGTLVLKEGRY